MKSNIILGLILLLSCNFLFAKQIHVSPDKKSFLYNGKSYKSYDIQDALSQSIAQPGDTIWIHEGRYNRVLVITCKGTKELPILISSFPGEARPIIDGAGLEQTVGVKGADNTKLEKAIITASGANYIVYGLEITNTNPDPNARLQLGKAKPTGAIRAIEARGPDLKFINLDIHDVLNIGIGAYRQAVNCEIIGVKAYHNGTIWGSEAIGGGIYQQNDETNGPNRKITGNVLFDNMNQGLRVYGSNKAILRNFTFANNILVNNTYLSDRQSTRNILFGGSSPLNNIVFTGNHSYLSTTSETRRNSALLIGYDSKLPNTNLIINNNFIFGSIMFMDVKSIQFKNNLISQKVPSKNLASNLTLNISYRSFKRIDNCTDLPCYHSNFTESGNTIIFQSNDAKQQAVSLTIEVKPKSISMKFMPDEWFKFNREGSSSKNAIPSHGYSSYKEYKKDVQIEEVKNDEVHGVKYLVIYNWGYAHKTEIPNHIIPANGSLTVHNIRYKKELNDFSSEGISGKKIDVSLVYEPEKYQQAYSYEIAQKAGRPDLCNNVHPTDTFFNVFEVNYFPHNASIRQINDNCKDKYALLEISGIKGDAFMTEYYHNNKLISKSIENDPCRINETGEIVAKVMLRNGTYTELKFNIKKCN